jgi:hypothetical protein
MWGYWSKKGHFTLVTKNGLLAAEEISSSDATIVRNCGGFLFDRQAFAEEAARTWSSRQHKGAFTPVGNHRVFVLNAALTREREPEKGKL